jgi:cytochrome c peroxidase
MREGPRKDDGIIRRAAWARHPLVGVGFGVGAVLFALYSGEGRAKSVALAVEAPRVGAAPLEESAPIGSAVAEAPSAANEARHDDAARVALGRAIFFDTRLSVPEGTSCASCHDPKRAFAGNHGSTVGVALGSRPDHYAKRNTPSVLYLRFVRKFHLHWEEDAPLVDAYGGFFWDGRTDSLAELVKQPLLNPDEMNGDAARAAGAIASGPYAEDFAREFGSPRPDDPEATLASIGEAVNAFLLGPEMSPFSSRYDDYVRGDGRLAPLELEGLRLFKDSAKGGCSTCHKLNDRSRDPKASLFTDYEFDALGAPRNRALPATRNPDSFDLGLCERGGEGYKAKTEEFCGRFRTPSLRNVAVRKSYMHNGAFSKLRDVVAFYATRDTNPERWYRGAPYDDLPSNYRDNVNTEKAPYNRRRGEEPALDDHEIDAVVAFLGTLTDAQYR